MNELTVEEITKVFNILIKWNVQTDEELLELAQIESGLARLARMVSERE